MVRKNVGVDHDRLFKELLETFFAEFMDLFFPEVYPLIDFGSLHFQQQELFANLATGDKRYVDLLVETKLKEEDGVILIHLEHQAQYQSNFAERMFTYFTHLYQKYRCRIIPIALFSYDQIRDEPSNFNISFSFLQVLDFNYYIIELKKKNWREYLKSDNPVAAALLSKMGYNEKEKVSVKLEFLKMLTRLRLDPARNLLLTVFFESYLQLDLEEEQILEEAIGQLEPKEAEEMLELTTSWHEKGRVEGRQEGKIEGRIEGRRETAQNLLRMGISPEQVAKAANLPLEEILKMKKEIDN